MDARAISMIRSKYRALRQQEMAKRNRLLKEEEAETKKARQDLELKHRGDIHYIHEGFNQAMGELSDNEFAELEAARAR